MKSIGIFAIFPPRAALSQEGLGRYFETLIQASSKNADWLEEFNVELVIAPWSKAWGEAVTSGTSVRLRKLRIHSFGGVLLYLWGSNRELFKLREKEFTTRRINRAAIAWTIHKWSAGIVNVNVKNPFHKIIQVTLRFFARVVLYLVKRIRRKDFDSVNIKTDNASAPVLQDQKVAVRKIFDKYFANESSNSLMRESKRYDFIFLAHNRVPFTKASPPSATLVPDLIPLEYSEIFERDSARWKNIADEIAVTCVKSKLWITFSGHTKDVGQRLSLLTQGAKVNVIRHASQPPSQDWADYFALVQSGMANQWVDYWWRSGLLKVKNPLFQNEIFDGRLEYCIYPTQYRPHKNVEKLINSWPEVISEFPTVKLILTADPEKNSSLVELVRSLHLSNSVLFIPKMSGSELIAWCKRAKLVISASSAEGAMPFMVSEALTAEVPFLISDTEVSREILPEAVQQVSFLDSEDFAASIKKSLRNREDILAIQKKWYGEYHSSWTDVWNDWLDVAREELNG